MVLILTVEQEKATIDLFKQRQSGHMSKPVRDHSLYSVVVKPHYPVTN